MHFLKHLSCIFLVLNIYTCIFNTVQAQKFTLDIKAEKEISNSLKDSLQIKKSFPDLPQLKKQTDTILMRLQRKGFIESKLLQLQKTTDSTYIADVYLGEKHHYLKIYYNSQDFNKRQLQSISSEITDSYFILNFEKIPNALQKLTASKTEKGNAFVRLKLSEFEKDNTGNLSATLAINYGDSRTIDSIAIRGYEKFPRSYLTHFAGIKRGKTFNQKKLIKQSEKIKTLGFATSPRPPEVLFRADSTIVYFYFEKQNNNLFDGILGFATDEETQKLKLNGYLNLELNNNLNYGEQILLNYKADGEEQISFRAKATLPYLFKTPFGLGGELNIFKKDSTFITSSQEVRATYQINPNAITYIGYKGTDSSNLLDNVIAGTSLEDYKSNFLIFGASYIIHQNRKLFPIKTYISLDSGIGSRKTDSITEPQLGILLIMNHSFNLNQRNSIYVNSTTNALISDTYLRNELFRFGGINSIRGFNENSIDASLFSVINTEYRYQFSEDAYIHSIVDAGYFENPILSLKQNLFGFGLGMGLKTKAGLFKLNIANGYVKDKSFDLSNTKIHISISSQF